MLKAGADVNAGVDTYYLDEVVEGRRVKGNFIITAGGWPAEVGEPSKGKGATPLHFAANNGHKEIANILIRSGADMNKSVLCDGPPLRMITVRMAILSKEELVLAPAAVAPSENEPISPAKCKEMLEFLIESGADVNCEKGRPLVEAITRENMEIVKILLRAKADPNLPKITAGGDTLLHSEVLYENHEKETIELLLKAGAKINATNSKGETPLWSSIFYGKKEDVDWLIRNGANVNITNEKDETPLFYAVSCARKEAAKEEIIGLLIDKRADVNAKDSDGRTPLFGAVVNFNSFQLDSFRDGLAKLLIKKGANVNVKDKEGDTPLHLAVNERTGKAARLLLENGADPHAKNNKGSTPTDYAKYHGAAQQVFKEFAKE